MDTDGFPDLGFNVKAYGDSSITTGIRINWGLNKNGQKEITAHLEGFIYDMNVERAIELKTHIEKQLSPIIEWRKSSLYEWCQRKIGK